MVFQLCSGYDGDGIVISSGGTGCQKRNPCEDGTAQCPDNSSCENTIDGYECICSDGYKKPANGNNICKDIDECSNGSHTCHKWADCANTDGSFECTCKEGTVANGDACEQLNECQTDANECSDNADCTDINFGYMCDCKDGYEGDGINQFICIDVDECTKEVFRITNNFPLALKPLKFSVSKKVEAPVFFLSA